MKLLAHFFDDLLGHLIASEGDNAAVTNDIGGAPAGVENGIHGSFHLVSLLLQVKGIAQHHGGGQNGGDFRTMPALQPSS